MKPEPVDPLKNIGPTQANPITGPHQGTDTLEMPRKWTPEKISSQAERQVSTTGGTWYWCGAYRIFHQSYTVVKNFDAFATVPSSVAHELPSSLGGDQTVNIVPTHPLQGTVLPGVLHRWTERDLEELAYKLDRIHIRFNGSDRNFVDWGTARLEVAAAKKLLANHAATDPDPKMQRMIEALRTDSQQELAARAMQQIEPCLETDIPVASMLYMMKVPAEGVEQIEREMEGFRLHRPTCRVLRWRPSWASWPYAMGKPLRQMTEVQIAEVRKHFKLAWKNWQDHNIHALHPNTEKTVIHDLEREFDAMLGTYAKA